MVESFDVIVVGGGPGGSGCAALITKKGYRVLLLDKAKFPRDKTCGDAISGKSLSVLKELDLPPKLEAGPHAVINGITFSSPNGVIARLDFSKTTATYTPGYVIRREVLDNTLFQHAKNMVAAVREHFQASDLIREGEQVVGVKGTNLDTGQTEEFRAPIIIGADGATSTVAQKLGYFELDPLHHCVAVRAYYKGVKELTDQIEIHFVDSLIPGYFWIFPLENGLCNVGAGMLTKDIKEKRIDLKKAMFDAIEVPLFKKRFEGAEMVEGTFKGWNLPLGSKKRPISAQGVMLIGDAASLIDPFSGEGIGNALSSGRIAANIADEALKARNFSGEFFKQYDERVWEELWTELHNSYRLQRLGRWKFLLNLIVGKAARSQMVREALAGTFSSPNAMQKLASPMFYVKLLFA